MTTESKKLRDILNNEYAALFHVRCPNAAQVLFERSQALWAQALREEEDPQAARLGELVSKVPIGDAGQAAVAARRPTCYTSEIA